MHHSFLGYLPQVSCGLVMAGLLCARVTGAESSVYLSDAPELVLHATQGWGVLGIDQAAHQADRVGEKLKIGSLEFSKGVGHHASGRITVLLEKEYANFEAVVGVQPCGYSGTVMFRVLVDGEQRFESGLMKMNDEPRPVTVDVTGGWELTLEADDGGDGISCDMANWADAKLVRSDSAVMTDVDRPRERNVEVARFGRVVTSDPNRMHGTLADRLSEFPAEDLELERDLRRVDKGWELLSYAAGGEEEKAPTKFTGSVGVMWLNRRAVRLLEIEFERETDVPDVNGEMRVEGWYGESLWQGEWRDLAAVGEREGRKIRLEVKPKAGLGVLRTWKIRWVFPMKGRTVQLRDVRAWTRTRWEDVALQLELDAGTRGEARIEVVDGELLEPRELHVKAGEKGSFVVRSARESALDSELTTLRVKCGENVGTVAVRDIVRSNVVYVPSVGVQLCRGNATVTIAEHRRRVENRKTVLEQVRGLPDQTLEQALAKTHRAAQNEGPVMLSLASDNAKVVLERNGEIKFQTQPARDMNWMGTASKLSVRIGRASPGEGSKSRMHERFLEGHGWMPVPVITWEDDSGLRTVERVFVAPGSNRDGTTNAVCAAEWIVRNGSKADMEVFCEIAFNGGAEGSVGWKAESASNLWSNKHLWLEGNGRSIGRISGGRSFVPSSASGRNARFSGELRQGETGVLRLWLGPDGQEFKAVSEGEQDPYDFANLMKACEEHWRVVFEGAMEIETPEPFLNDVIKASRVRCLIAARNEAGGKRVAPWIAAMSYGPLESEAHAVIRGMDFLGHEDFARRGLDFFISRYNTNGFLTTGYTTFGTGWHLWSLGEHWGLWRDTNWLLGNASELARVGNWVVRQAQKAKNGLMPPGVLADWNAFSQHFCMNAYYATGLRGIGEALGAVRHPDAEKFRKEGKTLAAATVREYERTSRDSPVVPLRDGTWVPYYPGQVHTPGPAARFFPGEDAGRTWAYNIELGAHQMVPTGVLPPMDERITTMVDHMEDSAFLESGWFDYPAEANEADWFNLGGFAKVQPYYCRNAEIYAMRDDVRPFIRTYFNSLASLLNREVLTLWEHFNHSGAWDKTHETGYFLYQTRTMLLQERGENVVLAPFVPSDWLLDGRELKVRNAPTSFGRCSYSLKSALAQGRIVAHIEPPEREFRGRVWLRLRHPEGATARSVTLGGREIDVENADRDTIVLPKVRGPMDVVVSY